MILLSRPEWIGKVTCDLMTQSLGCGAGWVFQSVKHVRTQRSAQTFINLVERAWKCQFLWMHPIGCGFFSVLLVISSQQAEAGAENFNELFWAKRNTSFGLSKPVFPPNRIGGTVLVRSLKRNEMASKTATDCTVSRQTQWMLAESILVTIQEKNRCAIVTDEVFAVTRSVRRMDHFKEVIRWERPHDYDKFCERCIRKCKVMRSLVKPDSLLLDEVHRVNVLTHCYVHKITHGGATKFMINC